MTTIINHFSQGGQQRNRYDILTRRVHWIAAGLIIYTMIAGYSLHFLIGTPYFSFFSVLNMSIGTVVIPLTVVRYVWKFFRPSVPYPADLSLPKKNIAHMAHEMFYLVIFVMLISGVLMLTHSYTFFWLIEIPNPINDASINGFFFDVHRASCAGVAVMLILHLAAVAKHQLIDKRNILGRML